MNEYNNENQLSLFTKLRDTTEKLNSVNLLIGDIEACKNTEEQILSAESSVLNVITPYSQERKDLQEYEDKLKEYKKTLSLNINELKRYTNEYNEKMNSSTLTNQFIQILKNDIKTWQSKLNRSSNDISDIQRINDKISSLNIAIDALNNRCSYDKVISKLSNNRSFQKVFTAFKRKVINREIVKKKFNKEFNSEKFDIIESVLTREIENLNLTENQNLITFVIFFFLYYIESGKKDGSYMYYKVNLMNILEIENGIYDLEVPPKKIFDEIKLILQKANTKISIYY